MVWSRDIKKEVKSGKNWDLGIYELRGMFQLVEMELLAFTWVECQHVWTFLGFPPFHRASPFSLQQKQPEFHARVQMLATKATIYAKYVQNSRSIVSAKTQPSAQNYGTLLQNHSKEHCNWHIARKWLIRFWEGGWILYLINLRRET